VSRLVAATMGLALAPLPGAILFLVLVMRGATGSLAQTSPSVAPRQLFELADLSRVDPVEAPIAAAAGDVPLASAVALG